MPRPLKEYRCHAHGPFESRAEKALCPHGCNTVVQEFRTPPMIATARSQTQAQDGLQQMLASRYGLHDLKTPDPGQTMHQRLKSTGSSTPIRQPTSAQEVVELNRQGINTGTVFLPLKKDDNPVAAYAHSDGSKPVPGLDHSRAAQAKLRSAEVVNRPNPSDTEDLSKAMTELGAA